ncbi:hypothetical protein BsWGS_13333 [Bradybaena similaris]
MAAALSLLLAFTFPVFADTCTRGGYNLTRLHSFSPWYTINDSSNTTFKISLCDKLATSSTPAAADCPDGTSVCLLYPNGTAMSYGNYTSNPPVLNATNTESRSNGELVFMLKGQPCLAEADEFYSTFFYFKCGKTLGYPYYVGDMRCSVHIEWESYIFCKQLPVPDTEVPCTLIRDGHRIDLSPLIKTSGGYLVDEENSNGRQLYINVCRGISPGTAINDGTRSCPKECGSCKVIGNTTVDQGRPTKGLEATESGVRLVYSSKEKPAGCLDYPSTTINFRCPQRGGSREPRLLSSFLCGVQIDWPTEFACPVENISSKTCQLNLDDIHVDLLPLSGRQFKPYIVNVTDGQDHYQYKINICDTLGDTCGAPRKAASICQTKSDDETFFRSLGENAHMTLRYSDNKLTMIVKNGQPCSSNFRRETLIEFFCNTTAVDDGKGYPEFVEHSSCSYHFKWDTKFACPKHAVPGTCSLTVKGKKFDLSPLVKAAGTNWEVMTGDNEDSDQTIFLNVCSEASQCPAGSAVCRKGASGVVSLGQYSQPLQYDEASNSLRLTYTDGAEIKETRLGCKAQTTIKFVCAPGKLDGVPMLISKTQDDCYHEVEWQTSVACVLHHKTGDRCRVADDDAGYMFDLNPLTYPNGSYAISGSDGYSYLINVCAAVKDQHYCTSPPHNNASICQVKTTSASAEQKKVAEPTSVLEYFDGVLNLTYTDGEPYNNAAHTKRMAEIAFICDMTVDRGRPEFLEERNFTYAFLWRTSYACPTVPIECVVTDTTSHLQYDLSSLAQMSQNWKIEALDDAGNRNRFYINVCRPLRPIHGVGCSSLASVCATRLLNGKEVMLHGNLGRAEAAPLVEVSTHGVRLVYTNGDTCHDSQGHVSSFRTTIHFTCVPGQIAGGPAPPQLVSPCEYSILWQTEAACPVSSVQSASAACQLKDPNTNFVFNLQPLYKPEGYNVTSADASRSFQVNICGGLPDSACGKFDNKSVTTVCELGRNGNRSVAKLAYQLEYSSEGQMTLSYPGHIDRSEGGAATKFVFSFVCSRTAQAPVIQFDGQSFLSTTFKVSTALACPPQPVSCVTHDAQGRQFDLTALARDTGNWVVIDTRPTHKDLSYHINVCRPVNPTPDVSCPGGAVGACQTGTSGNFSLGYVQSEPVVSSIDGVVTIRYDGGDKCHKGTPNESSRSTRIIFFCDQTEHDPVFEGESINCEYTFAWRTPSACPQQVVTGSDCKVVDPLYNFEFDLSSLRRSSDDYNISASGYHFLLNVCGPLVKGNCGTAPVAACQTGPSLQEPVHIGAPSDKLKYNMGQISLIYSDGKGSCHHTFTRSTIINFICDHSQTGNTVPQYVQESSDCTYMFEWRTSAACPPHQISDCTFKHGDDIFDLSRLARVDGNYERVYNESKVSYIINVCRSLVHKIGQTCPFSAAACMINLTETDIKKRFHNIGEVSSQSITYEHGLLMLRYDQGELCEDGKTRRSTVILFQCDPNTDALGSPGNHFTLNGCEEHFMWTSSAACPLQKTTDSTAGFGSCQVTNPNTGYVFDLSDLKKSSGYKTYDREGHEFTLNVCAGLSSASPCTNGTGSCQVRQTGDKTGVSAGQANANLIYRDGLIMLNYSTGDVCDTSKAARSTYINFVCAPGAGAGLPVFIDQSANCLYYFDWHTQLVCETELACEVTTDAGYTLDLSALVKKSGKYNVLVNSGGQLQGVIYINLCRPLNPIYGTLCPAGSGACLVRTGHKPLSLGHVDAAPVWDSTLKHVKLTYTNGDPCPSNPKVNMTSVILLTCGSQEQLVPQLETVTDDCQYVFMWETSLACETGRSQPLTSNCTFYDYQAQMRYDLSSLSTAAKVVSSHGGSYSIQVCGQLEDKGQHGDASCDQSSVCLIGAAARNGSFGMSTKGIFQKDSRLLGLTFSGGRVCHKGSAKAASTIYFECDQSAGLGQPDLYEEDSECEVAFRWKTSLVCPIERQQCVAASKHGLYDFSLLSQDTGSYHLTDSENNTYFLNLCQSVHGSAITAGCAPGAAVCRLTPDGKMQVLGQLATQNISVSDGPNPTITISYTEGSSDACNVGRRRRSDITSQVLVTLTCGDTLGSPVLLQYSADSATQCVFQFAWKTKMACDDDFINVPVVEKNGVIVDSRTKLTIDLRPLISLSSIEHVVGNKKFLFNLGGLVAVDGATSGCQAAAACLLPSDLKSGRNLGTFASRAFYMQDDHLEVVFTSNEKCAGSHSQHNVTTTIKFNCNPKQALGRPELLYQTSDCAYIFTWDTSLVCLDALLSSAPAGPADGLVTAGRSAGAVKIAIGVSLFMAIVVACILIIVLHKPERRAVIGSRLKGFILCRKHEENPIVYSRLSQSEHEDSVIDGFHDPFNPFEPDEETEINNSQLPVRPPTYHDDSDEDMLL